ncbi:hypothetical protein ACFFS2_01180 [Streptomyces aurantiacus]|nr:hypothetical protein [Streptomyces aurantiacus]
MTVLSKIMHPFVRFGRHWLSRSGYDLAAVIFVIFVHLAAHFLWSTPVLLHSIPTEKRPSLYGATATVVSLTGTLASVTVAQYLTNRGDRVEELKRRHPENLARAWRGVFLGSVLATALFLVAYALDSRTKSDDLGSWLFEAGVMLALARFVRLALLFGELIQLIVLDDTNPLANEGLKFTGAIGILPEKENQES